MELVIDYITSLDGYAAEGWPGWWGLEGPEYLGSLSLARALLAAGLVDRFRVVVFPVITGRTGRERIDDDYPDLALELIEARTFDQGTQLLDYRPRLLDAALPPGSPLGPGPG